MKCLYCDKCIDKYSLYSLFVEEDMLCINCRKAIKYNHKKFKIDGIEVETFYEYKSLYKQLLLQYKECYDEALKDVFLYKIKDYIKIKYFGYRILYAKSSINKTKERGFNHLEKIFESLNMKKVDGLKMISDLNQQNKNLNERLRMEDNFSYEGEMLDKVLIVDDVITTGSTIKGIYKAIRPYARKIRVLVLAK